MKIKQYAAALAVATLAGTGATIATTAAPASAAWDSCDLGVKLAELQNYDAEGKYNIIVWKDSAYESADLKGVKEQGNISESECSYVPDTVNYHWAIFEEGTFTRKGDGGYRNWAFTGVWDRPDDTHVTFHKRF